MFRRFLPWQTFVVVVWAWLVRSTHGQFTCTLTATDESGCLDTTGDDGKHCVWCAVSSFGFCVNEQQAESMEANIPGVECDRYSPAGDDDDATPSTDDDATPSTDDEAPAPNDDSLPDNYWTCLEKKDSASCIEEGCTWCDSKGGFGLCLTGPSADMANESEWFTCKKEFETLMLRGQQQQQQQANIADPYDPMCALTYLQDQSEEACKNAVDADDNPCQYCTLQGGAFHLCLNAEQAEMGQQFGIECDAQEETEESEYFVNEDDFPDMKDPYDPTCALAFLEDQTEEACKNAVDSDGNPCEFCTLQGALNLCLNEEQAQMGEQLGIECNRRDGLVEVSPVQDPYDPTCALAYLQDQSEEACKSAVDSDGNPCEYCTLQGAFNLCLNEEQAQMGEQMGIECETSTASAVVATAVDGANKVEFPSDFWDCLENYDEGGCESSSCTWCNTEVGVAFCVADSVADAMHQCTFFDCNYKTSHETQADTPFDSACLGGSESQDACNSTKDTEGNACVWCDAAGVFGLCLSADGAKSVDEYLTCDAVPAMVAAVA